MPEIVTTKWKDGSASLLFVTIGELTEKLGEQQVAEAVAGMVNSESENKEGEQMLTVSPESVLAKHIGVVALNTAMLDKPQSIPSSIEELIAALAGFAGSLEPISHNDRLMSEVGSLKVSEQYRGHGIGTALFWAVVQRVLAEGITPYAFCNSKSLPIAERLGGRRIADKNEVPDEAFALCTNCPMYQQVLKASVKHGGELPCCDTVVVWKQTPETESSHPS